VGEGAKILFELDLRFLSELRLSKSLNQLAQNKITDEGLENIQETKLLSLWLLDLCNLALIKLLTNLLMKE